MGRLLECYQVRGDSLAVDVVEADIRVQRVKALRYLARYKGEQGFGHLCDPHTGSYCAIGVLGLGLGIDARTYPEEVGGDTYGAIDYALGENTSFIEQMNDGEQMPFGKIAEELMRIWNIETKEIYP